MAILGKEQRIATISKGGMEIKVNFKERVEMKEGMLQNGKLGDKKWRERVCVWE